MELKYQKINNYEKTSNLLIVLNGIEIQEPAVSSYRVASFNRTKWN